MVRGLLKFFRIVFSIINYISNNLVYGFGRVSNVKGMGLKRLIFGVKEKFELLIRNWNRFILYRLDV